MALIALLTAGCTSVRHTGERVRVTPSASWLTADAETGEAVVKTVFHVPADYLGKRDRLVITPCLWVNDTLLTEYVPLVLDAPIYRKKNERRIRLGGYEDPYASWTVRMEYAATGYDLPFEATVTLPEEAKRAELIARLSVEECVTCSVVDTLAMASLVRPDVPVWGIRWMEPEFVVRPKVMEGSGEAQLRFTIDKDLIDPSLGDNRAELERLSQALAVVLKDSLATMNSLTITGMASADGARAYNLSLAHARAEAARDWLACSLDIDAETKGRIAIDARPEGWEPVLRLMEADGHPGAAQVREILRKWPDSDEDRQERAIRKLACWEDIRTRYLATDRKVAYTYTYTLRSFTTEEELRTIYRERPDAFNEEEWLRLASLMRSDDERREVYEAIVRYFPRSEVAINNLAVICLRAGDEGKAREWLCRIPRWCAELDGKRLRWEE